ncbi:sigma-54-dependent transcriptional regulator [Marinisporobacter balticus]|uniref:Stage 0 sporulation protein A homolog n=1 Tax=Marinisporobacter balticus TaxID=2018667 RepID=A0A4R2KIW2_9FIRM|nr:sigma-54 dependent transcriptional regulator [Marinisporobacter balticus]TCO73831.1 DNA-binding NtrC family response regulator [Marinisporobacter balticus]
MKDLTILIAEDEENLAQLLARIFENTGYKTHVVNDGETALYIVKNQHIDIVITDIRMPSLDGISLLKEIKAFDPYIEVLVMTAFANVDTAIDAIKLGARDYIRKPFDIDEVLESIEKAALLVGHHSEYDVHKLKSHEILVDNSLSMKKLKKLIKKVACSTATVNIYGETGVGKELVAKAIHELSDRSNQAFIKVNCSAFPETLLESELFGYEKGAFTGAFSRKLGRFELANGGTIFLDEIGDISLVIQLKLLRVIQQKEFERLGSIKTLPLDLRIITATNKDLKVLVKEKKFREDLYYRLNVIPIDVAPLRERKEDIQALLNTFIRIASKNNKTPIKKISDEALDALINYPWPGNVRELENIVERMIVISDGNIIELSDLPEHILLGKDSANNSILKVHKDEVEERIIRNAMLESQGNMTKTAEKLGISRRSLYRKIHKYSMEDKQPL